MKVLLLSPANPSVLQMSESREKITGMVLNGHVWT